LVGIGIGLSGICQSFENGRPEKYSFWKPSGRLLDDLLFWHCPFFSLLFMGYYRFIKGPLPPSPPLRQPPTNSIFEELREKYRAARSCNFSEAEAAQKAKASAINY
jgi:hypothetical protein